MSDFLTNLISRSLGLAPVIQPRLPSLFEPSMPYGGWFAETAAGWEEVRREALEQDEQGPAAPEQRRRAQFPKRDAASALPLSIEHPSLSDGSPAAPSERINLEGESAAAITGFSSAKEDSGQPPLLPVESARDELRSDRGIDPVAASARNGHTIDFIAPPAIDRPSASTPPPSMPGQKGDTSERRPADLPERKPDAPRRLPAAVESLAKSARFENSASKIRGSVSGRSAAVEPLRAARFELARHVAPPSRATPPEPTIQVTIGRIEVRAVSSQPARPKERSASPVMSLNEYLQHRSKRGSI